MKVPLEWLKEYVPVRLSPQALTDRLTMAGLEVTRIESVNGEPVLDLEVTPNRADCLSIIGVAREVAAITGQRFNPRVAQGSGLRAGGRSRTPRAQSPEPRTSLKIQIEDRKGCPRYIGRLLEGVKVAPSPAWMQRRLLACGARPINNVVDITNYVLLECGQPLHAFDFERVAEGTILVRRAHAKEPLTTLDGISRALAADMLVIADAKRAMAVAGIMGGVGSEVTPQTTAVLLESALFDPVTVRRTARALGLASESSYRFERGVDPVGVETASARAARLIAQLAGAREVAVRDAGTPPAARTVILLNVARMAKALGVPVTSETARTALARLSCHVASSGAGSTMRVGVPSFRRDLLQEVDLDEEVARLMGYERIPKRLPHGQQAPGRGSQDHYERLQSLRSVCASLGLTETINWALVSDADLVRFGWRAADAVRLANPLSQDHAYLRPSLLIGLLQTVRRNLTQGAPGVRVFELGGTMRPGQASEHPALGFAISGVWARDWQRAIPCDFFRLKGVLQAVLGQFCDSPVRWTQASTPWAEPGQAAEVRCGERLVGVLGQLAGSIAKTLDLEQDVWFAEMAVEGLLAAKPSPKLVSSPALFPSVKRDLSLVVDDRTGFEPVDQLIREVGRPLASRVELIDRYAGQQIPRGKHSLTFSIEYRDASKTLTAAEVEMVHRRIGAALVSHFGATLRLGPQP